mgnify:CR=1 FL=1
MQSFQNLKNLKHAGYQVGQAAANLLIDLLEHPKAVVEKQLVLETYLVELDSCWLISYKGYYEEW